MRPLALPRVFPVWIAVTACAIAGAAPAGTSTSEPTTPAERRLLEPDLNRTFNPDMARFSSRGASNLKETRTTSFTQGKEFANTKDFLSKKFSASEFLPGASITPTKPFVSSSRSTTPTQSFSVQKETLTTKYFESGASHQGDRAFSSTTAKDANLPYLGQEAERMKEKHTPSNPPQGGVSMGRRLSVEEVKDILNKSK
jgi:hypothetical protein